MNHYPPAKEILRLMVILFVIIITNSCKESYYQSAFVSDRDGNLDLFLSLNKGEYLNLTNDKDVEYGLSWSPDGKDLVFAKQINKQYDLFLVDLKTKEFRQLTNDTIDQYGLSFSPDGNPDISPDGKRIAYNNFINGKAGIFIMNIDGSGIIALTNDTLDNRWPRFTPDGKFIAYTRVSGKNADIWIMDCEGKNKKEFVTSPQRDEILELRPFSKTR